MPNVVRINQIFTPKLSLEISKVKRIELSVRSRYSSNWRIDDKTVVLHFLSSFACFAIDAHIFLLLLCRHVV